MRRSLIHRFLLRLGTVRDDEVDRVAAAFTAFLFALAGYFVALPLRDEAGVALGAAWLPSLFTCSLLLTSIASPAASAYLAAHPHSREQGVASLFSLCAGSMIGFLVLYGVFVVPWADLHALLPHSLDDNTAVHLPTWWPILPASVRAAFFLWLSLLNLLAVSSLWTVMADRFTAADAKRLFGVLGAGATLGQLLGSLSASASAAASLKMHNLLPLPRTWTTQSTLTLAKSNLWTDMPPFLMPLLLASFCYFMSAKSLRRLAACSRGSPEPEGGRLRGPVGAPVAPSGSLRDVNGHGKGVLNGNGNAAVWEKAMSGKRDGKVQESWLTVLRYSLMGSYEAAREGVIITWCSPYLRRLCGYMILQYVNSSLFYFEKNLVVAAAGESATHRTAFFAAVNSASATCIMLLQLLVTGRLIVRLGIPVSLLLAPLWSVFCMLGIFVRPSQSSVAAVEVARKLLLYSVTRPSREVLFTVVSAHSKYKVKLLIDTIMQRVGDTMAAALLQGLQLMQLASPHLVAGVALGPLSVWAVSGLLLGRQFVAMESKHVEGC